MSKIFQVWKQKLEYTVCFSPHWVFGWVLIIHLLICPFFSYSGNNFAVLPNALYSEMKLSWNKAELKWDYQRSEHIRLLWYSKTVSAAHCGVHTSWRNIWFPHTVPCNTGAVKQHKLILVYVKVWQVCNIKLNSKEMLQHHVVKQVHKIKKHAEAFFFFPVFKVSNCILQAHSLPHMTCHTIKWLLSALATEGSSGRASPRSSDSPPSSPGKNELWLRQPIIRRASTPHAARQAKH